MMVPTSWAVVKWRTVTCPVCGSTATSATWAVNDVTAACDLAS